MKIIECPRDAMQGMEQFIPTESKISYINSLLDVGFDTIDFGSFVSPKAVPQMKDTAEVLGGLDISAGSSKLLAIIANLRGVDDALQFDQIKYLGFPLSISETFQQRNTNSSIEEAFRIVEKANDRAASNDRELVVYVSMGFGNPYGDPYDPDIVIDFFTRLRSIGVSIISLADTVGAATESEIKSLFPQVLSEFMDIEVGAHLHSNPNNAHKKIQALIDVGCTRIDGAIKGFGGCPMAKDDLVGNLATETILQVLRENQLGPEIDQVAFDRSLQLAGVTFPV